jgi:hypothetical protein
MKKKSGLTVASALVRPPAGFLEGGCLLGGRVEKGETRRAEHQGGGRI